MAVELVASTLTSVSYSSSGSFSVTVPADADMCLVFFMAGDIASGLTLSRLNFRDVAGNDFTQQTFSNANTVFGSYTLPKSSANFPASGSRTLYWQTSANQEGRFQVSFLKNADQTNPVVNAQGMNASHFSSTNFAFPTVSGHSADNMTVCGIGAYIGEFTINGNSQTQISNTGSAWSPLASAYKMNEDVMEASISDRYTQYAGAVLVLRAAAAATAVPKIMLLQDQFSGGIH